MLLNGVTCSNLKYGNNTPNRSIVKGVAKKELPSLTTTSYAVLGLLCVQPWTAYDLAQQMTRSTSFVWPRATSGLYNEPNGAYLPSILY